MYIYIYIYIYIYRYNLYTSVIWMFVWSTGLNILVALEDAMRLQKDWGMSYQSLWPVHKLASNCVVNTQVDGRKATNYVCLTQIFTNITSKHIIISTCFTCFFGCFSQIQRQNPMAIPKSWTSAVRKQIGCRPIELWHRQRRLGSLGSLGTCYN